MTLRLLVDQNQCDGQRTAVVGSDCTGRVLDAGSGREDESSDVCRVCENAIVFL